MCEEGAVGREIRELKEETCAARVCNDGGCRDGAQCLSRGGCGSGGFNRGRGGGNPARCQTEIQIDLVRQSESRQEE